MSSKPRLLLAFLLAVLLASLLASIFQTQANLAALQAIGAPVPLNVRLGTTALDLLGFTPTFILLSGLGFVFALPLAAWLARRMPADAVVGAGTVLSVQAVAGTDLVVRVLDAPALRALEQEEPAAALELWRSMARAASEDLETALRANIGWEPGDHWNETPVED